MAKVYRAGYSTLPRPTVAAISIVGAARMRAATATVAISIAGAAAIARRGAMPALIHGENRKKKKKKEMKGEIGNARERAE